MVSPLPLRVPRAAGASTILLLRRRAPKGQTSHTPCLAEQGCTRVPALEGCSGHLLIEAPKFREGRRAARREEERAPFVTSCGSHC